MVEIMTDNKWGELKMTAEIRTALRGELDSSRVSGDILYYDELARGRVFNRLYRLFDKLLATTTKQAVEEEREKMITKLHNIRSKHHGYISLIELSTLLKKQERAK